MVTAHWSGKYPNLCSGEWTLIVDGKDVSDLIPREKRKLPMDTHGIYRRWRFSKDWDVVWSDYVDGLSCEEWIHENSEWLNAITDDESTHEEIFHAIQEKDFRCGSCGGCI